MAILLVTYDLRQPGKNYQPLYDWLKKFAYCKGMDSVWLLDTHWTPAQVRDELQNIVDNNDRVFVTRLHSNTWASLNYSCGDWLNNPARSW